MVERMRIDATGLCSFANGIAFSSQTNTTATGAAMVATTLNHYETGTWTPTLWKNVSSVSTQVTSMTTVLGFYTRVGNLVWLSGYLLKSSGSHGDAYDDWQLKGMPFSFPTNLNSAYQFATIGYSNMNGVDAYGTTQAPSRWQANTASVLTLYGVNRQANWASGVLEFSFTGVFKVA
jgi:hypothetical protein